MRDLMRVRLHEISASGTIYIRLARIFVQRQRDPHGCFWAEITRILAPPLLVVISGFLDSN